MPETEETVKLAVTLAWNYTLAGHTEEYDTDISVADWNEMSREARERIITEAYEDVRGRQDAGKRQGHHRRGGRPVNAEYASVRTIGGRVLHLVDTSALQASATAKVEGHAICGAYVWEGELDDRPVCGACQREADRRAEEASRV